MIRQRTTDLGRWVLCAACLWVAACAVEPIVHDLDEREANQIVELLALDDIEAMKQKVEGREVTFIIAVPAEDRLRAIQLLNFHEMPRRRDKGYNEVFAEGGLIPTAAEEKAKKLAALEGEIERQLKVIDGIHDVQVQIVVPEESALRTTESEIVPTTASVTVRYMPGAGGAKPLSEPQVQAIVAGGVEKLTPENVVVVMTPVLPRTPTAPVAAAVDAPGAEQLRLYQLVAIALAVGIIVLLLGIAFSRRQLKTVRGRLIRLQTEIQKARKKGAPGGDAEGGEAAVEESEGEGSAPD